MDDYCESLSALDVESTHLHTESKTLLGWSRQPQLVCCGFGRCTVCQRLHYNAALTAQRRAEHWQSAQVMLCEIYQARSLVFSGVCG